MLYVTKNQEIYPALYPLTHNRGNDGERFMPYRLDPLTDAELDDITGKDFGCAMAAVLNLFFGTRLTEFDVNFLIGREPFRLFPMNYRILYGEIWQNSEQSFDYPVRMLSRRIIDAVGAPEKGTEWGRMAIRIGAVFGLFAEMRKAEMWSPGQPVDMAVDEGDFSAPMSLFYAREMGLPIDTVICGCEGESSIWNLLHQGEFRVRTGHPQDPSWLEHLIRRRLGREEADRYAYVCRNGGIYAPGNYKMKLLRDGFSAAVVSPERMESIISGVYQTSSYLLSPETALAYGGLQDYRALNSETRPALILSEFSPEERKLQIVRALGLSEEQTAYLFRKN